jgi:hypothetical protein
MSWWELLMFGNFEAWITWAIKNPASAKSEKIKPRLIHVRDMLNRLFVMWGWE